MIRLDEFLVVSAEVVVNLHRTARLKVSVFPNDRTRRRVGGTYGAKK